MTVSPEEAKRLAAELLMDSEPAELLASGLISIGSKIGGYTIESLIATGGMGAVYRATHEQPTRVVALKVVRPDVLSRSAVHRFRLETEVLARLQHPGVAQIFEAGSVKTDLGDQPYFAMEFVEGQPLLDHADDANLGTRDRLALFLKVCDAVEHAHKKGVIHRDLKPGNVLVTPDGQPKILDFGVAKATDSDFQSTTMHTDVGQLVGTLPYMSPEQVGGVAADLDTRSDVYSLGVLLYHLLSGHLPYDVRKGAVAEALRTIQEEDPEPLSTVDKTLRGDVETIVFKALEKDRDRRYQGASELGEDIKRYLANETITARPASAWYQISKFSRRNRGVVVAASLLLASLVMGIGGTTGGMLWALGQKSRAETAELATQRELTRTTEVKQLITEMISRVSPEEAQDMDTELLRRILDDTAERLTNGELVDELIAAELHLLIGATYLNLGLYPDAERHIPIALGFRTEELGPEHPNTLKAATTLAHLYTRQGLNEKAEQLILKTLAIRKQVSGIKHQATLDLMTDLANSYRLQARFDEAESLGLDVLKSQTRLLGEEHPDTMKTMQVLAALYNKMGQNADAERLNLTVYEIRKRTLGEEHPLTLAVMNNLALVYKDQGNFSEAESLYLKTVEIDKRIFGEEHPTTLQAVNNLAIVYQMQSLYKLAEPLFRDTLDIQRRVLGLQHPDTLASMGGLATIYSLTKRFDQAEPLLLDSLEIQRQVLAEGHPDTLGTMGNLAVVYYEQELLDKAEHLFLQVIELKKHALGDEHPSTLRSMGNIATLYGEQDRLDEAETLLSSVLEIKRRVLGEEHLSTIKSMNNLASTYDAQGRYPDAEELYKKTLTLCERALGNDHHETLIVQINLGSVLSIRKQYSESREHFESCLPILRRDLGLEHPWTTYTMEWLAEVYVELDLRPEAAQLYRELLDIQISAAEHTDANASTLHSTAKTLLVHQFEELRDPEQSLSFSHRACMTEEYASGNNLWKYLDTLALAQHRTGDTTTAIETQKRAISLIPETEGDATREELAANLRTYEASLEQASPPQPDQGGK